MICPGCSCVFCPDATGNPRVRYCSPTCRAEAAARRRARRKLCQQQRKDRFPDAEAADAAAVAAPFPASAYQCGGHWHITTDDRAARRARHAAARAEAARLRDARHRSRRLAG